MYLLDTNIVSEARRGAREPVDWLRTIRPDQIYLSVITLGEITRGIALLQKRDAAQASRLQQWLNALQAAHSDHIVPISVDIALTWGRLSAIRPRGDADGLIAATASHLGLTLVTRNSADFDDLPIALINPWTVNS
jgi:toxin FitB